MSFSTDVKNELIRQELKSRHCMLAETAAIVAILGHMKEESALVVETENTGVAKRYITLIKELFGFAVRMDAREGVRLNHSYMIRLTIDGQKNAHEVMAALKLLGGTRGSHNSTERLLQAGVHTRRVPCIGVYE